MNNDQMSCLKSEIKTAKEKKKTGAASTKLSEELTRKLRTTVHTLPSYMTLLVYHLNFSLELENCS